MNHRGVRDGGLEETGGARSAGAVKGDAVSAVGSNVVSQVPGGFVDDGECEGELRGCCGSESCQVVGVFTSFSPDGLELGQGRPSSRNLSSEVIDATQPKSRRDSRSTRSPARHYRRSRLELGGRQPEATFTHRDEELFCLRHSQVAHTQDGLVSLTNHSVHFTGKRGLEYPHFPCANSHQNQLRLGEVLVQCGLGVRSQ